jgi:hypothetical protein
MLLLIAIVTVICVIILFAWPRKHSISEATAIYKETQRHRDPISAQIFLRRAGIPSDLKDHIDKFRNAISEIDSLDPERIYPEDSIVDLGFIYDDDLAMFLFDKNLLTNKDFQYSFPLEDVSCFSDVITITETLNKKTEQDAAANP